MAGSTSEIVRKMVLEIKAETEENMICADCKRVETRESMVEWVSVSRGVFICIDCAGIHRRPRDETPIVRSIRLDTWSMGHWEMLKGKGNQKAKMKWEADVPACWVRPWPKLCPYALREQWIEAKYTRKEFTKDAADNAPRRYLTGEKQGPLMKKKRQSESDVFRERWFVVKNGVLSYYRDKKSGPKDVIPLMHANVVLHIPEFAILRNNSMLIIYYDEAKRKTRNIFVKADTSYDIIDWYLVIRQSKINLLKEKYGNMIDDEVARERASQEYIHYGWLHKTSPTGTRWSKRFFVLDGKCLRYYSTPRAAFPVGELVLGSPSEGYWVDEVVPDGIENNTCTFMLHVPDRLRGGYPLVAPDTASKKQWMSVLTDVIDSTRATPQVMHRLPPPYDDDVETMSRTSGGSGVTEVSYEHRDSSASESSN
jgi:hypothetical protein